MILPMSSTGGGGGGGGGTTGFTGFLAAVPEGLGLGFELPAAGFLVVVAGLAGAVVWATETDASAHAATRAAARFKARGKRTSMGADSTHAPRRTHGSETCFDRQAQRPRFHGVEMPVFDRCTFAGQLAFVKICDVVVVRIEQVVSRE